MKESIVLEIHKYEFYKISLLVHK